VHTDLYGRLRLSGGPPAEEAPIFVFATGERCGSTMVQRFLSSHPDVMLWGEQLGALDHFAAFYETWLRHARTYENLSDDYAAKLQRAFVANLSPGEPILKTSARQALRMLYGGYAKRWGCKEIRCGAMVVEMLRDLFPGARFVLLTRDVQSCLRSLAKWEIPLDECKRFTERWARLASEFRQLAQTGDPSYLLVRYEDFVRDYDAAGGLLAEFLGLDGARLDFGCLQLRVADHGRVESVTESPGLVGDLTPELRALIADPQIRSTMDALGYRVRTEA